MHAHLWPELLQKSPDSIIFMCNPTLSTDYVLENRILSLKCGDTYDHLPTKVYRMIASVLSIPAFDSVTHVFKIDDHDTVFDSDTIGKLSMLLDQGNVDYGGQNINFMKERLNSYGIVGNVFSKSKVDNTWHYNKSPKTSRWYNAPYLGDYAPWIDGGCGYVLSRKAMHLIDCTYTLNVEEIYQHYIYVGTLVQWPVSNLAEQKNSRKLSSVPGHPCWFDAATPHWRTGLFRGRWFVAAVRVLPVQSGTRSVGERGGPFLF
jgi:hypothetical protein